MAVVIDQGNQPAFELSPPGSHRTIWADEVVFAAVLEGLTDELGNDVNPTDVEMLSESELPARSCGRCLFSTPGIQPLYPGDACPLPKDTSYFELEESGRLKPSQDRGKSAFASARLVRTGVCEDKPNPGTGGELHITSVERFDGTVSAWAMDTTSFGAYGAGYAFRKNLESGQVLESTSVPFSGQVSAAVALPGGGHLVSSYGGTGSSELRIFDENLQATRVRVDSALDIDAWKFVIVPEELAGWAEPGSVPLAVAGRVAHTIPVMAACQLASTTMRCELTTSQVELLRIDTPGFDDVTYTSRGVFVALGSPKGQGVDVPTASLAYFDGTGWRSKTIETSWADHSGGKPKHVVAVGNQLIFCADRPGTSPTLTVMTATVTPEDVMSEDKIRLVDLGLSQEGYCLGSSIEHGRARFFTGDRWLEIAGNVVTSQPIPPLDPPVWPTSISKAGNGYVARDYLARVFTSTSAQGPVRLVIGHDPAFGYLPAASDVGPSGPEFYTSNPVESVRADGTRSRLPIEGLVVLAGTRLANGRVLLGGWTGRWEDQSLTGIVADDTGREWLRVPGSRITALAEVSPNVAVATGDNFTLFRLMNGQGAPIEIEWDDPNSKDVEVYPVADSELGRRCAMVRPATSTNPENRGIETGFGALGHFGSSVVAVGCPRVVVRAFVNDKLAFAQRLVTDETDTAVGAVRMYGPDRALLAGRPPAGNLNGSPFGWIEGRFGQAARVKAFSAPKGLGLVMPDESTAFAIVGEERAPIVLYSSQISAAFDLYSGSTAIWEGDFVSVVEEGPQSYLIGLTPGRLLRLTRD